MYVKGAKKRWDTQRGRDSRDSSPATLNPPPAVFTSHLIMYAALVAWATAGSLSEGLVLR